VSGGPRACERCLRKAWVVAGLSFRIERALEGIPGRRTGELLALEEAELRTALPAVRGGSPSIPSPRAMREAVTRVNAWVCCLHDESYPGQLRDLGGQAPACLFGRGDHALLSRTDGDGCVTVVGSRRPSAHGRDTAELLGRELAAAGFVVVSGMALGIDSCAHEGALAADGVTVAVLGSGPDVPNPARMRRLYGQIVATGLVLGELPPGVQPRRWTFPARNRIMAALGSMAVVVEARSRSGSLITADMAQDLGREVGAVPGRVRTAGAAGTNQLLRDGAHVVRSGQDVLDTLLGPGARGAAPADDGLGLDPELRGVLELVENGADTLDAVARLGGLDAGVAAAVLSRLELVGRLRRDSAGRYQPAVPD
jgi:DNA processing protein